LNNLAGTIPIWVDQIREKLKAQTEKDEGLEELSEYISKHLSKIDTDTNRLLRAGEQLKSPPKTESVRINDVISSLVRQARVQMPAKIEIQLDEQINLPPIQAVVSEITNALWSIIENGIDAMPDGGKLHIAAKSQIDETEHLWVAIRVKDEGKGFLPEDKNKVFRPFYSTKTGHMGYGLWRARNIVERIGGTIDCDIPKGKGTTFTIKLPAQED
jgi:signal transduction histidine kinase